jgi:DNA (cytosine-5)-methyltransferase 1
MALGRDPDVAINHDPVAIAMHVANHPGAVHYREDVWQVPPVHVTRGQRVGLLWASPDCKHFSRAKGGPPKRDRNIRSLAWVVVKWAQQVKPRVIILENVEEFTTWGPLDQDGKIIEAQKGFTFRTFLWQLRRQGYRVEHRCLRACDYGAPTIRKRLFMVARCDGFPIVWPEPTHGTGRAFPYRTAAEIIDWSIPCPSIFERKRPLAENTLRRIAEGIGRYVIEAAEPFIVPIQHYNGSHVAHAVSEPLRTVTASPKGGSFAVVAPYVQSYYGPKTPGEFRGRGIADALPTQTTENRFALVAPHLQRQFGHSTGHGAGEPTRTATAGGGGRTAIVAAFLAQHNGGVVGRSAGAPLSTITQRGTQQQVVTSNLIKFYGTCNAGAAVTNPVPTATAALHIGEVRAFFVKYYGANGISGLREPLHTVTTRDRFGMVTVNIQGEPFVITDIGMRMLAPRELFRAQGFPEEYKIDITMNGRPISKADQVRMCGNSVCPPVAAALVEANAVVGRERGFHKNASR